MTKANDFNAPGFIRPITKKLYENKGLRAAMKVDLILERRCFDDPFNLWSTVHINKKDNTKEYTIYWQMYVREPREGKENNEEFRKKWGQTMTDLMNRAGKKFEKYTAEYTYAGDLGCSVIGEYCTVPYVFRYIEEHYTQKDNFTKLDIANDDDILRLHFGTDPEYIERIKTWYLRHIGIVSAGPNGNGDQNNEAEGPEEGDDEDLLQFAEQMM